jgi:hypothetical protein
MIIIGSTALKYHFPDYPKEPKDLDVLIRRMEDPVTTTNGRRIESYINPILTDELSNPPFVIEYIGKDELYTLKISHMFWDIKWEKHMFHIQFMREKGCKLIGKLFYKLYNYWKEIHGENHRSDLTMNSSQFFDNQLKTYDHDVLHEKLNPSPVYKKILKDGSEVEPDEQKFNNISFQDKLALVREEVMVMAYERLQGRGYREAYTWMLKKFIMNHAPIWEAIFIIENYKELHKPIVNYKEILDYECARDNRCFKHLL